MMRGFSSRCRGVTLTELLVTLGLLAVLSMLILPVAGSFRERSKGAQCLQRLRSAGSLLSTAITEQGGVIHAWYSGDTGVMWNTMLIAKRYLDPTTLRSIACPSIDYLSPSGSYSGRHYGLYLSNPVPENLVEYRENGQLLGRTYRINLRTMTDPSSSILLADSVTAAGNPTIRIFKTDSAAFTSGAFHARHQGRPNLFFYDGHVEAADTERLATLGVRRFYNEHLQAVFLSTN